MILVDSSVWIEAWRGKAPQIVFRLTQLVESGEARINYLIRTELLQGAKNEQHQKKLKALLSPIPIEPLPEKIWDEAPGLYLASRKSGITLTTIDCLIASHSLVSSQSLWSLDQIFRKIPGLRLLT